MLRSRPETEPACTTVPRPVQSTTRSRHPLASRFSRAALVLTLALLAPACASDKPTGPPAAVEIRVRDTVFQPAEVVIDRGDVVEWINVSREHRTVTSGVGPADAVAGVQFDTDLDGYRSGEPEGEHYRRAFTTTDTVYYFSRLAPQGFPGLIAGVIIIR